MHVLCPIPLLVNKFASSVVIPPLLEAIPTGPIIYDFFVSICGPPIAPTLDLPGEIIPNEFGPITFVPFCSAKSKIKTTSFFGILSVKITISFIFASIASNAASFAKGGGTDIIDTFALKFFTTSLTQSKTGTP
ncbi:hypothetical protein ES707_17008 [subsurface metagenome]